MRLHRLEMTAFGIFPDTVAIDFDALHEAGLFLLSGPTGAGKSSVLDAVCFALYGDVPGDRSSAKRFRSDLAAPEVEPWVTLDLSVSGRRLRIRRTPAWVRPKKRGAGTTAQHASVQIHEQVDGDWRQLTRRLDEAGMVVSDLLGMSLSQFCQVAMLPQGRFQSFLRARSDERHKLLAQLFRTGRFEEVERWLRDHRLGLRRSAEGHAARVAAIVSRVSEASRSPVPEEWHLADGADPSGLDAPVSEGMVEAWSSNLAAAAAADRTSADLALAAARSVHDDASRALAKGRSLADLQARYAAASAELDLLEGKAGEQVLREERLDAAVRAARLLPLLDLHDDLVQVLATAAAETTRAIDRLLACDSTGEDRIVAQIALDDAAVRAAREIALSRASASEALIERERDLVVLRRAATTYAEQLADLDEERAIILADLARLPDAINAAGKALDASVAARDTAAELGRRHDHLERRLAAARARDDLLVRLEVARVELAGAVDLAQQAKETWLDLRERRLTGMAAEIARGLVVGGSCPVCGSADHPHPAIPGRDAPDADDEATARSRSDDAEAARFAGEQHVRELTIRIESAEELVGESSTEALAEEARSLRSELDAAASLASAYVARGAALDGLHLRQDELTARAHALDLRRAGQRAAAAAERAQQQRLESEVADGLAGTPDPDLASRARRLSGLAARCDDVLAARAAMSTAEARQRQAEADLHATLREVGFDHPEQARAAVLAKPEVDALLTAITAHQRSVAAARDTLADERVSSAMKCPAPDLLVLSEADEAASTALVAATGRVDSATVRAQRVATLDRRLKEALAAWEPVRADLDVVTRLAGLVEGRSPDNALQMRLSAYVLAHRLTQVVAAANERLVTMSDRRYSLEHTDQRGAGETRGGLSLLVRDHWSGEARDPATLSGGETFVVSLALALGLADVLVSESDASSHGDARLESLFVDEGFGSLDADTLDDVLDTLDALREGGRVVGVVSHVAEMRDRIPTQVHVVKTRHGSTIHQPARA